MKSKVVLVVSSIVMSVVLATGVSIASTVSDEELNAALDARLKVSGVVLNTAGMTPNEQLEVKKQWYSQDYVNRTDIIAAPVAVKVSDEELNAAYDARLQANGVVLNTAGLTLSEQVAAKKQWYDEFYLEQSYDVNLQYFDIDIDTEGMTPAAQREAKQEALENWYENI